MSIFNFSAKYNDWTESLTVKDSVDQPGALALRIKAEDYMCGIEMPREQVEKLYIVLGRWLTP